MRSPTIVCAWTWSPLVLVSGAGLVEDRVGDRELADVVELGGMRRLLDLGGGACRGARRRGGRARRRGRVGVKALAALLRARRAGRRWTRGAASGGRRLAPVHALVGERERVLGVLGLVREQHGAPGAARRRRRRRARTSAATQRPRASSCRRSPDGASDAELVAAGAVGAARSRDRLASARPGGQAARRPRGGRRVSL